MEQSSECNGGSVNQRAFTRSVIANKNGELLVKVDGKRFEPPEVTNLKFANSQLCVGESHNNLLCFALAVSQLNSCAGSNRFIIVDGLRASAFAVCYLRR